MGTTAEKLQYTLNAVDDMQLAFTEIGVDCPDTDELATYGDKIRGLSNINVYNVNASIEAGVWEGVALSDSAWKGLCTSSTNSSWTYYFDTEIDVSNIQFIFSSIYDKTYSNWFRISKGYKSSSTTEQYQFLPVLNISGHQNAGGSYGGLTKVGLNTSTPYVYCQFLLDDYNASSSNSKQGIMNVKVYSDRIIFEFNYDGRGVAAIKTTTLGFTFTIGYKI